MIHCSGRSQLLRYVLFSKILFTNIHFLQLRTLANKIVNSPTIKEDLESSCRNARISAKLMIRDVSTWWNSTAELFQRALELKDALRILVIKADHNKARGVRLARFRLCEEEWVLLKQLSPLLEVRGPSYLPYFFNTHPVIARSFFMPQNKSCRAQLHFFIKLSRSWIPLHWHSTSLLMIPYSTLPFAMRLSGGS